MQLVGGGNGHFRSANTPIGPRGPDQDVVGTVVVVEQERTRTALPAPRDVPLVDDDQRPIRAGVGVVDREMRADAAVDGAEVERRLAPIRTAARDDESTEHRDQPAHPLQADARAVRPSTGLWSDSVALGPEGRL